MYPATASSSSFVTSTSDASNPLYTSSNEVAGAVTMLNVMSPSAATSSCPVMVIVLGLLQSPVVNVILAGETEPSDVSSLEIPIVTSSVGACSNTISKVAVVPVSLTIKPEEGATFIFTVRNNPKFCVSSVAN